jgi:pimeloyl-ACP methyl ester carboxylesterase
VSTTPLHVRELGDGPVLLLLHAFPCDGRMWEPQMRAAAEAGWRVLVPDLPGFGDSALLDADPDLDAVADALLDVIDERDIERAVVGGVSMGGYLAMALIRKRPSLLAGIALCGTKASADSDEARANRERLAGMFDATPGDTLRILEQAVLPGLLGDTSRQQRPDVVARVRSWLESARPGSVAWYQRAMAERPDSLTDIADIDLPTLVLWGEEDALSPRSEQDLMASVPSDARLVAVPGAGHLVNVEDPETATAALLGFLQTVRGPRHA